MGKINTNWFSPSVRSSPRKAVPYLQPAVRTGESMSSSFIAERFNSQLRTAIRYQLSSASGIHTNRPIEKSKIILTSQKDPADNESEFGGQRLLPEPSPTRSVHGANYDLLPFPSGNRPLPLGYPGSEVLSLIPKETLRKMGPELMSREHVLEAMRKTGKAHFLEDAEILGVQMYPGIFNGDESNPLFRFTPKSWRFWPWESPAQPESNDLRYGITQDGRHVVQQVGWRGCQAACLAMIQLDHGREVSLPFLTSCDFVGNDVIESLLAQSGIHPFSIMERRPQLSKDRMKNLELGLNRWGSGILGVGGEIGSHVLILDYLSIQNNRAVVREPFHGWSVVVTPDAIKKRL